MKSTPFNMSTDLAPIPFAKEVCLAAKSLKQKGLDWNPHVGCFVWDENNSIEVASPFPNQIYFILNLGHFLKIFDTVENMKEKLVWIPTLHQAKQICIRLNISPKDISETTQKDNHDEINAEVIDIYKLINDHL